MDKLNYKQELLAKAKEKQQELLNDFKTRMQDLEESEVHMNEGQYDATQHSQNTSSEELMEGLQDQMEMAEKEMSILENLKMDELISSVKMGAIVKTNHFNFFPSVSVERFNVGETEFFGISTKAPIYQEMLNKGAGDSFEFNGKSYTIEEVY